MGQAIKISVIIPVYNAERHLTECLNSVLQQSLREIEIICVDDGSTDRSLEILRRYAEQNNRIWVISQKNQYAGKARNNGMKVAQGKYLAFLDADDYYMDNALEKLFLLAEQNRLDFVKGRFCYLNTVNNRRYTTLYSINSGIGYFRRQQVLAFRQAPVRLLNAADVPWNGLYKRDFLEKNNITFNALRCVNDHSFYIHCLLKAERIMLTDAKIVYYRIGQAESLVGRKANHYSCHLESYAIVRDLCQNIELDLSRKVLRQELNGLFDWYQRLRLNALEPEKLDRELTEFLQNYNEQDVGIDYLTQFPFRDLYYRLRYGTSAQGRRPALPVRVLRCWQEHGWYYTFCRIGNQKDGVKPCD